MKLAASDIHKKDTYVIEFQVMHLENNVRHKILCL